jgi:hypothetical protein
MNTHTQPCTPVSTSFIFVCFAVYIGYFCRSELCVGTNFRVRPPFEEICLFFFFLPTESSLWEENTESSQGKKKTFLGVAAFWGDREEEEWSTKRALSYATSA